jgi:hypothetical protein
VGPYNQLGLSASIKIVNTIQSLLQNIFAAFVICMTMMKTRRFIIVLTAMFVERERVLA